MTLKMNNWRIHLFYCLIVSLLFCVWKVQYDVWIREKVSYQTIVELAQNNQCQVSLILDKSAYNQMKNSDGVWIKLIK